MTGGCVCRYRCGSATEAGWVKIMLLIIKQLKLEIKDKEFLFLEFNFLSNVFPQFTRTQL